MADIKRTFYKDTRMFAMPRFCWSLSLKPYCSFREVQQVDLMVLDKLEETAILFFEVPEGSPAVWDYQPDLAQMEPREACREVLGFFGEEDVRSRQTAIQSANDNEEVLGNHCEDPVDLVLN